jgi:hypothetical protein
VHKNAGRGSRVLRQGVVSWVGVFSELKVKKPVSKA